MNNYNTRCTREEETMVYVYTWQRAMDIGALIIKYHEIL